MMLETPGPSQEITIILQHLSQHFVPEIKYKYGPKISFPQVTPRTKTLKKNFFPAKWSATGTKQTCFHSSPHGKASEKRNKDNFASFRDVFLLFTPPVSYFGCLFLSIDLFSLGDNLLISLLFKFCFNLFTVEPH